MAQTWSPQDEEGFGIRGADTGALTEDQQKALDDLRVQTARDNQEYLHEHPEVKAMLSLLIRETLLQGRDVRSVAGEMFRSEKKVVAAVRQMFGMRPSPPSKRRTSDHESCSQPASEASVQKVVQMPEELPAKLFFGRPCVKRRDTPAPWIQQQLRLLSDAAGSVPVTEENETWVHRELEDLADRVDRESTQRAGREAPFELSGISSSLYRAYIAGDGSREREEETIPRGRRDTPAPWLLLSGKSSSQYRGNIADDESGQGEEEVIPLGRRDTPAPWLPMEDNLARKESDRESYVLGLLEHILDDPSEGRTDHYVFDKLQKIVEEAE